MSSLALLFLGIGIWLWISPPLRPALQTLQYVISVISFGLGIISFAILLSRAVRPIISISESGFYAHAQDSFIQWNELRSIDKSKVSKQKGLYIDYQDNETVFLNFSFSKIFKKLF